MELDDLKTTWNSLDTRMNRIEALALHDFKERRFDKVRAVLRWIGVGQAIQILIWGLVVATVGPFWIEHRATTHLLLFGLSLHLYGIITICASVVQLVLIARIDYSNPVLRIQRQLTQLRRLRIATTVCLSLPWWVLWLIATLVGAQWLFGIDLYALAPDWANVTLLVGALAMVLSAGLAWRWTKNPPTSGFFKNLVDDMAGCGFSRATRQLEDLARFERE